MKNVELIGTRREIKGTPGAKAVRRNKQVPCVLYGGKDTVHFSAEERALSKIVHSPLAHRVELNIDGDKRIAVLQDKQFQPVTDAVIHVDFMEALPGRDTRASLVVRLRGQSTGVRKGGKLGQTLRKVRVKGSIEAMPEAIELDITPLDLGESIRVRDLQLPGITVLEKPDAVVVSVKASKRAAETPAAAPAAAAPAAAKKAEPAKK